MYISNKVVNKSFRENNSKINLNQWCLFSIFILVYCILVHIVLSYLHNFNKQGHIGKTHLDYYDVHGVPEKISTAVVAWAKQSGGKKFLAVYIVREAGRSHAHPHNSVIKVFSNQNDSVSND